MQFTGFNIDAPTSEGKQAMLDTARLLLCEGDLEPAYRLYSACIETFTLWQQRVEPSYYELPLHERVRITFGIFWIGCRGGESEVSRAALTRDQFPTSAVSMRNSEGRTLLHAVAANLGSSGPRNLVLRKPGDESVTGTCHVPTVSPSLTKV